MIERAYYRVKFNTDTFVYVAQSNISLPNKIEEFTDDVIYSTDIGATIDTTEKWTLADGSIVENISCKRKIPIIAGEGVIVDADSTDKYIQISIDKDVATSALNIKNGTGKNSLIQVGCTATGQSAFASGDDTRAIHDFSFVAGLSNRSSSRGQAVFGRYNKDTPNAVFIVGTGHDLAVANGFEVLIDGRATVLTAPIDSIDVVRKLELDTKYDKAGGTIGGNVIITGDLTVNGTQHINNTENLAVKNAMIYSNSDGATLATNGGIGIKKNATDIYGIVYDPTSDSVKLGLGKSDGNGNFTFNKDEGEPVAIRDDSSKFTNEHLAKWDATNKKFVDSGHLVDDFVKGISVAEGQHIAYVASHDAPNDGIPVSLTKTGYSIPRRYANGQIEVGDPEGDSDAVPKKYAEDNFVKKVTDTDVYKRVYTIDANGNQTTTYIDDLACQVWRLAIYGPTENDIDLGQRQGTLFCPEPKFNYQTANKKYVDDEISGQSFKTLFGNQSIVGSGNIDLYNHDIEITGLVDGTPISIEINRVSSKNLVVDSINDLITFLGNEFRISVSGYLGDATSSQTIHMLSTTDGGGYLRYHISTEDYAVADITNLTITDTPTTV